MHFQLMAGRESVWRECHGAAQAESKTAPGHGCVRHGSETETVLKHASCPWPPASRLFPRKPTVIFHHEKLRRAHGCLARSLVATLDLAGSPKRHRIRSIRTVLHFGPFRSWRQCSKRDESFLDERSMHCSKSFPARPFPNGTWTSIAVLLNPRIGMHRDMQNMVGQPNHAITLASFTGGRVWIEDDEGTSTEKLAKNNKAFELKGSRIDIHDKPAVFQRTTLS